MIYNSNGTISYMSEVKRGTSQRGNPWASMDVMLTIPGYQGTTSQLIFRVNTDRVDDVLKFTVGDKVTVGWTIYAREWNGKYFNNVDLVNIKAQEETEPAVAPAPKKVNISAPGANLGEDNGDLPF